MMEVAPTTDHGRPPIPPVREVMLGMVATMQEKTPEFWNKFQFFVDSKTIKLPENFDHGLIKDKLFQHLVLEKYAEYVDLERKGADHAEAGLGTKRYNEQGRATRTPTKTGWAIEAINRAIKDTAVEIELLDKASIDPVTGMWNRNAYEAVTKLVESKLKEPGSEMVGCSVLMLDIDFFKKINDLFGHHGGDKVLALFGKNIRNTDLAFRIGGEEFVILIPHMKGHSASEDPIMFLKERGFEIANNINNGLVFQDENGQPYVFSMSAGGSTVDARDPNLKDTEHQADLAMETAKKHGRNRYVFTKFDEKGNSGGMLSSLPFKKPTPPHTAEGHVRS